MAGLDLSISSMQNNNNLLSPDKSDVDSSPYKSSDSTASTPRKNKRKSSEPKRRTDFSIKRFCPDIPHGLGHELDTEEGGGRPGYGEHPPSTPETSASSSTPSPPDVTQLRIPQVTRHPSVTSPPTTSSSPETVTSQSLIRPPYIPSPYAAMGVPYMSVVNPLLLQQMMGYPSQATLSSAMQQHLAAASGQIPRPANTQNAHPVARPTHKQLPHPDASSSKSSVQPSSAAKTNTKRSASHSSSQPHGSKTTSSSSAKPVSVSKSRPRSQSTHVDPCNVAQTMSTSRVSNDSLDISATSRLNDSLCSAASDNEEEGDMEHGKRSRKNYKNMTRERRIEANARERSRVHTISAAFETLRRAVPSFSHTQRLSKLAILRIACSYISALGTLAGEDYSYDGQSQSLEESVDQCTRTIQNEGRAKRRN